MLDEARRRLPHGEFVQGDALALPFPDGAFDRIFTGYFYCHLVEDERMRFLAEARRVAPELVVVGSRHDGDEPASAGRSGRSRTARRGRSSSAVFDPDGARGRARRATCSTPAAGSSSCARA